MQSNMISRRLFLLAAAACGAAVVAAPLAAADGEPAATTAPDYDTSRLDDGELRILDFYNAGVSGLGKVLFCGSKILCEATNTDSLYLIEKSNEKMYWGDSQGVYGSAAYYVHAWTDDAKPNGRSCGLYDKDGRELLHFNEEVNVQLIGHYVLTTSDISGSGEPEPRRVGSIRIFDLDTGAELAVPQNTAECCISGEYFAFSIYTGPTAIDGEYDYYSINDVSNYHTQIQDSSGNIIYDAANCIAYESYTTGWFVLTGDNYYNVCGYYCPASGFFWDCGQNKQNYSYDKTMLIGETADGKYELYNISNGQPAFVAAFDTEVIWATPTFVIVETAKSARDHYLYDIATGESTLLYDWDRKDKLIVGYTVDGVLRCYDISTGKLLCNKHISVNIPDDANCRISIYNQDYIVLNVYRSSAKGKEEYKKYYSCPVNGKVKDITALYQVVSPKYKSFYPLTLRQNWLGQSSPLFYGTYTGIGGSKLYDVVDMDGNVLLQGLGYAGGLGRVYDGTVTLPQGCFKARRGYYFGWMDYTGQWLYCRSVFSSMLVTDGDDWLYY